ncbi:MAG TPA: YARHG domain-containing protein, partial [Epulopiscium sp.]|nr:YARHG domain-containing protein [Candidatus Epulonipiscium sp.]
KDRDTEKVEAPKSEVEEGVHSKKKELEVLELKAQLESQDILTVYMAEFDLIEAFKTEVESLIEKKDYTRAMQVLEEWKDFSSKINRASSDELKITQIDVSAYPIVKVYLGIQDYNGGQVLKDLTLEYFYLSEKIDGNESYIKKEITKAIRLDKMENLNINLVADVSGSMQGSPITYAQEVMRKFVGMIQFQIGDKVSLISFADQVYSELPFSSDANAVINAINGLKLGNKTALYDALYVAINQTAMQSGAKCIIAFTDGMDNASQCTPEIVVELATRYGIPIFIIGVGADLDNMNLNYITNSTGGFYRNIESTSSMDDIYNAIYEQQKDLYLIEYETDQLKDTFAARNLYMNYLSEDLVVNGEYKFTPAILMETTTSYSQLFINDFIIYDSDFRYLTVADLRMLTKEQLRLARNEIYARRGRMFLDQELQNYFNSKAWYRPTIRPDDFKEHIFNDYEKANAYFIRDYENLHGFN